MNQYKYKNLKIEIINEQVYEFKSSDNHYNYSKHYFGDRAKEFPVSKHGIKISDEDQIINNCIIIGSGGATGVYKTSTILDDDKLVLCCCDTIFCLQIPTLELNWKIKGDEATCFQIIKHQDDYIVHGEMQVTKLDKNGRPLWEFGGKDIFVSINNEIEFKVENDGILLTDFSNTKYKIDFDGKLIWQK